MGKDLRQIEHVATAGSGAEVVDYLLNCQFSEDDERFFSKLGLIEWDKISLNKASQVFAVGLRIGSKREALLTLAACFGNSFERITRYPALSDWLQQEEEEEENRQIVFCRLPKEADRLRRIKMLLTDLTEEYYSSSDIRDSLSAQELKASMAAMEEESCSITETQEVKGMTTHKRGTTDIQTVSESPRTSSDHAVDAQTVISPVAYLRAMANLVWCSFRHPLTTTEIDLATGKIVSK